MEPTMYRYTDPRTGDSEYASPADIDAVKHFLMAWKFYWDGPLAEEGSPTYERATWLFSDQRSLFVDGLTEDQRTMLIDSYPPEEVPTLERSS